tara:strand:- start:4777 stop:7041 length:2265 start_codon:yes stop_codon:yes gene_type:complete
MEMRKYKSEVIKAGILAGVSWGALLTGGAAVAAEADAAAEGPLVLEEITVTARKRDVALQNALVAVSVASGDTLDSNNVMKMDDFNGFVPGLNITKNDGAGRVVAIRGVGWETSQNLSTQPGVLFYVDGVYIANPLAIGMDLGELERVEVFRGPQGTEFGQNTTGGAINVVTKKPDLNGFSGGGEISLGTYNLVKARGHLNIPLSDTMAVRASLQKHSRDGFAKITGIEDYDLDDANSVTGKLALAWEPSEDISVLLTGFWQDSEQHGAAAKSVDDPIADARVLTQDYASTFELYNSQYYAVVEWKTPLGALKSLTSYQYLEKHQTVDADRLDFATAGFYDVVPLWDNNSKAFSQEINLSSDDDGPVQWTVGGYYLWHKNYQDILELVSTTPAGPGDLDVPSSPPTSFPANLNFQTTDTVTRKDSAVYGQLTWSLTDWLSFTGGMRYQNDKSHSDASVFYGFFGPPVVVDTSHNAFTWKAGFDISLSEDNVVYVLASTGYRNGGNNSGSQNAYNVPFNFKPETVRSYEIGSKNKFFDKRMRLNIAAFYYDYEDYQFIAEDAFPFSGGADNIPGAHIYGVEAEFSWLISDKLRLDGFVAALDGEFTEDFYAIDVAEVAERGFEYNVPGRIGLLRNLNGNEPAKLVSLTSRMSLTYATEIANKGDLTVRGDYVYRGDFEYRVFNNPTVDKVPSYNIVNLNVQYKPFDSRFSFSLTASNLFDKDGVNSRFTNPYGSYRTSEEYIPPREVVGSVKVTF